MSVIIPVHNGWDTIGMTLSSLLAQTMTDWEAIVVDDGSSDATERVVAALSSDRVHYVFQAQGGAGSARNRGIELASGKYVAFLDADDFIFPEYLERSLAALEAAPARHIVTHNAYYLFPKGIDPRLVRHASSLPKSLSAQQDLLLMQNFASIMSVFPKDLCDELGSFDTTLERAEDWDFWLRASFSGWTFVHQAQPLAIINRSRVSLTTDTAKVSSAEAKVLAKASRMQALNSRQLHRLHSRLRVGEPSDLWAKSQDAVDVGEYRSAARLHWLGTRMATREVGPLARSAAFRVAPHIIGRLKRRRMKRQ